MKRFLLIVLLLLVASNVNAQTLVVTKSGYYLLTQDAAGVPTLTRIENVILLDVPTPPPPPPNPTDPFVQHRAAVGQAMGFVRENIDNNKTQTRKALARLYATVAGLPVVSRDQLVSSTDLLFNALNLSSDWKDWKSKTDASLARFVTLTDARRGWQIVSEVLDIP